MSEPSRYGDRVSIVAFSAVIFLFWAVLYVYEPVLSVHAKAAGASLSMVGLIVGVYGFSQLFARIPLGMWSDRIGKRKPFVAAAMVLGVVGGVGLALRPDPTSILVFRGIHGLTAAAWVNISVLFASYFPPSRATNAMRVVSFINAAAMLAATFAGGQIAAHFGRIETFWVATGLAVLSLVLLIPVQEEKGLATEPMSWSQLAAVGKVPALVAVSALAVLAHFIVYAVPFGFVPIFAQNLGANDGDLGMLRTAFLLPYTVATLAGVPLGGRLGDRRTMVVGMLLMAAGIMAIPLSHDLEALAALQGVIGFGRGMIYPVMMAITIRSVQQSQRATAMGIFQAVYAIGMFLGPATGGMVADTLGLTNTFLFNGAVGILAAGLCLWWIPGRAKVPVPVTH